MNLLFKLAQAQYNWVTPKMWGPVLGGGVFSSAPFVPSDFGTVRGWWKADAIVGLVDNDPVASWVDSGPNGFTLTQATGANRPVYKTAIQNSLPIVRFDGTNDLVSVNTGNAEAQTRTVFAVFKESSASNMNVVGSYSGGACVANLAGLAYVFAGTSLNDTTNSTAFKVVCGFFNGASSTVQTNAGSAVTGAAGSGTFSNGYNIGAYNNSGTGPFLNGDMCEVLVYTGSCSNISAVITALRTKWGI